MTNSYRNITPLAHKKIKVVRHKTPRAIVSSWFRQVAGRSVDAAGYECGAIDQNGEKVNMTADEFTRNVNAMGLWGFSNARTKSIHFWARPKTPLSDMQDFFAHEYGHLAGFPRRKLKEEELRADSYASVARLAYREAQKRSRA